jgi:branched-chain amino acid transport system permease protein
LGGLASSLVGLIFSYPLSKTKGFAYFIASAAVGEAMRLSWTRIRVPFGAHQGIINIPPPGSFMGIDFSNITHYYFLTLVVTVVCLLIIYRVENSRIGDTFKSIASKESLSRSIGINIIKYKILAFIIGSFFAGIAGVLLAHAYGSVSPSSFSFIVTLYMVVWVIFGGMYTFAGPMLGLAVLTVARELLLPLVEWVPLFYGIILILTLLFLPGGLESIPKRVSMWWIKRSQGVLMK